MSMNRGYVPRPMKSYRNTATSNISDVWTTFHFHVAGQGDDALTQAIFTEVSGLEVELEVTPYEEGGMNTHVHKLPGRTKVSDITLKNGIMTNNGLWDWFKEILQGTYTRKNVTITLVSEDGEHWQSWEFAQAIPIKWTGPKLKADSTVLAIQSLVLTHKGLILR